MTLRLRTIQKYVLWLLDTVCIYAAFQFSSALRYGNRRGDLHRLQANQLLIFFILFCFAYNFFLDWNHTFFARKFVGELIQILRFNLIMFVASMIFLYLAHFPYAVSRLLVARFFFLNIVFMLVSHQLLKLLIRVVASADLYVTKVFVIAEEELMERTISRIGRAMDVSAQIVGAAYAVDREAEPMGEVSGVPVASGLRHLTALVTKAPFDEVFFNTPSMSQSFFHELIQAFEEMGVICHFCIELPDTGAICEVGTFGDYSVVTYKKTLVSTKKLIVKRIADIFGGIIGLIITAILTIFIAPAIKLDSPGPVFFSQVRVGKNGRRFKIYKFRSMYQDAEDRKKELSGENEMQGPMFKMADDPRVTKVGAFLRRTSLDEFPQFYNVLVGDMSLVGTRPPTEAEFEQYDEHYRRRISMTPGLTGMWQVSGRSDITDFDEVVRLDLEYIDHWSLMLDVKIILRTIRVMLTGKGAK